MAFNIKLAVKNAVLGLQGVTISPVPEQFEPPRTLKPSPIAEYYVRTQVSQLEQELVNENFVELKRYKEEVATGRIANELSELGVIIHEWKTLPEGGSELVSRLRVVLPKKKED